MKSGTIGAGELPPYNANQSVLLLEFFVPVEYHFGIVTGLNNKNNEREIPKTIQLLQNYPNPFNPVTTIQFEIPGTSQVILKIYNVVGEKVATLVSHQLPAGSYSYEWNGANVASGIYFYRLEVDGYVETKKMVLMK